MALGEPLFEEPGYCERHAGPETSGPCVHQGGCTLRGLWQTLELWMQPPNASAPKSLGTLPPAGRETILPVLPVAGTALSISLEPLGGSPTGAPTGRVVYAGALRPIPR